ncbi:MAG: radical SAM protein, partial [Thermodesulfobacteriota bacterium]|nr:radical SAM protein [Thermodesulfobacteriota bacterium]
PHPLEGLPTPRYDLINRKNFFMPANPVQATRGCPYHCDFCSVSPFFGSRHRKRPVADVLADMDAAGPYLVIVDDNLMIDRDYALGLFAAMKPLDKVWIGQVDVRSAADGELMKAAADAGCRMLYLGIETLDRAALARTGKTPNLHTDAEAALMQIKRHHMEAFVSMIIGFDNDTAATAMQIVDFCNQMRVPILFLYILTPIPGSPMFERMKHNGTPLKPGWHLYDGMHSVFDTPSLKSEELEDLYVAIQKKIYAMPSILRRTLFPPHVFLVFLNLWARKNVHSGLHPWMGNTRWRRQLDLIPLFEPLTRPWIRKISRLLRFTEGRFTR